MNKYDLRHNNLEQSFPSSLITANLEDYQKKALTFLTNRENDDYICKGGLLLDDPGCGKTLQMLTVICSNSNKECKYGTTLVICSPILINVWKQEIRKHTKIPEKLIGVYYDIKNIDDRIKMAKNINRYMFILTSYGMVTSESGYNSLFNNNFRRIILDEAHIIRNINTKISKTCFTLKSNIKWVVTATPIVNEQRDFMSYFIFLGIVNNKSEWREKYSNTLEGIRSLRETLNKISIRRYKNDEIKNLPLKTQNIRYLNFNKDEQKFYDDLKFYYKGKLCKLAAMMKDDEYFDKRQIVKVILVIILRLRQCCNDPNIVKNVVDIEHNYRSESVSTKTQYVLNLIKDNIENGRKVVIGSQWLVTLNPLEKIFNEKFPGVKSIKLNGTISSKKRFLSTEEFQNDPNVKVCFLSLCSSAEGITLTAASTFISIDPWWNSAKIEQSVDRIYRYGQKNNVNIIHLRIKGSIEENMQLLIKKKKEISKTLIGKKWKLKEKTDNEWINKIIKLLD